MPREVRTNVGMREVITPISRPRATEVVARPTDQFIQPALDPELHGLVTGLAALSPSLQQYAYASRFEQAKDNEKQEKAGLADRQQGKALPPTATEMYKHGHMWMDGQIKAKQDGQAFKNRVLTEFNPDEGNLEEFTRTHFEENLKGVQDKSYLEGYHGEIAKDIGAVRDWHLKYQQEALVAKTESNFMARMDGAARAYVDSGMPVPVEVFDTFRKEGKEFFGISAARFNDLRFATVKSIGDEGNPAIFETLKQKTPDGTPGMYDMPEWKDKITSAHIHSQNVYLQNRTKADAALKKQREDNQDTKLYEVFLKAESDPEGARQDYANLRKSGLFTHASELVEWDTKFASTAKREASAGQQQIELDLQQGIYTGQVRPASIMKADVTPAQKRALMSEWYRVKNDNQQAAANGQKAEDLIFKTQHFKSGEDYIETVLRPQASPLDPMGIGTEFARQQLATARREFTEAARTVKNPNELYGISQEITTRYLDRTKNPRIQKEMDNAGSLRYSTPQELEAAVDKGLITDPIELQNQIRYFKSLGQTANASR